MKLLKMRGPNCLLYSTAMLLGEDVDVLVRELGHDGMEQVWSLPAPRCFRSFHIQEIIDCFISRGFGLMPIEANPLIASDESVRAIPVYESPYARMMLKIMGQEAILIMSGHACAWNGEQVYDPNGAIKKITDYGIIEAWIKVKMI